MCSLVSCLPVLFCIRKQDTIRSSREHVHQQVFQLALEIRNQDVSQVCLVPFAPGMSSALATRKRCYFADMTLVRHLQAAS